MFFRATGSEGEVYAVKFLEFEDPGEVEVVEELHNYLVEREVRGERVVELKGY